MKLEELEKVSITDSELNKIDAECENAWDVQEAVNKSRIHGRTEPYFCIDCKDWRAIRERLARTSPYVWNKGTEK